MVEWGYVRVCELPGGLVGVVRVKGFGGVLLHVEVRGLEGLESRVCMVCMEASPVKNKISCTRVNYITSVRK